MSYPLSRRELLKSMAAPCLIPLLSGVQSAAAGSGLLSRSSSGRIFGSMTGAKALVETLIQEGTECVFGIPGAQENELWDTFKTRGLGYLLVTHEFSAAAMADGYARSTGKPGVLCVVPGPGVTNSLSGVGETLLDSIPLVCIVGDVARGDKYHPFQLMNCRKPVCCSRSLRAFSRSSRQRRFHERSGRRSSCPSAVSRDR